jgi:ubiquinol-cytochrome c reductase cytochrome c subunit
VSTTNQQSDTPLDTPADRARGEAGGFDGPAARARSRRRAKRRRRIANVAGLMAALVLTGVGYSFLSPTAHAAGDTSSSAQAAGRAIYERTCISCHGENLQGVPGRGPSLIGVGGASVYFQVHTGRMPLVRQGSQAADKPPVMTDAQVDQLVAFVQAYGGGPAEPSGDLQAGGNLAQGGELFRLNCASCHNFTGEGGALSSGKSAPPLTNADDLTIYAAMLSGPENMPVFGDNQLTPQQKHSIIDYIQTVKTMRDPGGSGIGRIGPVSEGLVIWTVGMGALLFLVFWMGSKA